MGGFCLPLSHWPSFHHHVTTEEEGVHDVFFLSSLLEVCPNFIKFSTLNGGSLTDGHHNSPCCLEREGAVRQPIMPLMFNYQAVSQ